MRLFSNIMNKNLDIEIWKDVVGYEGFYKISSKGNVLSVERMVNHPKGGKKINRSKLLSKILDNHGYLNVHLSKNNIKQNKRVHVLVAESFMNHSVNRKFVIDHVDNDKKNNSLYNLQIIKQQVNNTKDRKRKCRFTGVSVSGNKWRACSAINKKKTHIGLFPCELSAAFAYNNYIRQNIKY